METPLTYDMRLEVEGVLRSQNLRVKLNRELGAGETGLPSCSSTGS
jgi:hypothetical protein